MTRNCSIILGAWISLVMSFAGDTATFAIEPDGQKSEEAPRQSQTISPKILQRHVEYLASPKLEGRGTARGKSLALNYISRQFQEMELQPLFPKGKFTQDIPGPVREDGSKPTIGRNIGGWLMGSDEKLRDEIIILSAHYDHLGVGKDGQIYTGADDNAGSVAMLLEVARRFSVQRPRRSLVFLSCDLEEHLLWGSRWFVAHPPWPIKQVKLFITAEMIGRTLGDLPMKTIFVMGAERGTRLRETVDEMPVSPKLDVAHLGIDVVGTRSDYGPFQSEKIPFLFFSGGEHPDYHTPRDTPDRLDYERVADVSSLIESICRSVANADEPPLWIDRPEHDLAEIRTLHRITELLLKIDDEAEGSGRTKLNALQRFTVTNMKQKTEQILERGTVLPDDRPGIIRNAQLLLLTVF
jgi:hypothetical protein